MKDLKLLLGFARPYRGLALAALFFLLCMVALDLAVPRLVQQILDVGVRRKDIGAVISTSAIMLGVSALSALSAVLNSNISVRVGESVARDVRDALFARAQAFSYADMDRFSTGKLMVRLTSDAGAAQRLVQISLRIGTRAPLSMVGSVALMFATSPALAWPMVPILAAAGVAIALFSARMEPRFLAAQNRLDALNTVLQENVAGARLVKAFARGAGEAARFERANAGFTRESAGVMQYMSSMGPILTTLVNLGIVVAVWTGGIKAAAGGVTIGQVVAFVNYLLATLQPLVMMTQLANTWANGLASAGRLREVLELPAGKSGAGGTLRLPPAVSRTIEFKDVSFHYGGDSGLPALEGISFRAEAGMTLAVLGATGSGKTTLANLLAGFYAPGAGGVEIDGVDLRDLDEDSLRGAMGIAPQEAVLFAGSVMDNLRYGRPEASEGEARAAARAAEAEDFILGLPAGYATRVEERGVNLSGGQKQRVAIARALVGSPSILVLDDSTSAVDVETELRIHAALAALPGPPTRVVIAQRISTVLEADLILVLEEGRLAAAGRHAELMASSAVYREIYESQLGGGVRG